MKVTRFRDLFVWQKGHALVLKTYQCTSVFPPAEQFGLTNQLRRAAVSVTSNIAEGFSRHGVKEKLQFYYMSLGSLSEVENQVQIANDVGYIEIQDFESLSALINETSKLLNSLILTTRLRK